MTVAPHQLRPRQQVKYKKPRRLNAVSLTLAAVAAVLGYVGYCVYPVVALHSKAKSELEEVMPRLWRLNLLGAQVAARELPALKKDLLARLRAAGVRDKDLEVVLHRDQKIVAAEAHFKVTARFDLIDKTHVFSLSPRAQTDAARVDW